MLNCVLGRGFQPHSVRATDTIFFSLTLLWLLHTSLWFDLLFRWTDILQEKRAHSWTKVQHRDSMDYTHSTFPNPFSTSWYCPSLLISIFAHFSFLLCANLNENYLNKGIPCCWSYDMCTHVWGVQNNSIKLTLSHTPTPIRTKEACH